MTTITCLLKGGIGNRLYQITHTLSISKMYNIDCFFSDIYSYDLAHKTNYYYKDNIFKKLKFDYYCYLENTSYGLNYNPIKINNNVLLTEKDLANIYDHNFKFYDHNYIIYIDDNYYKTYYIEYKYFNSKYFNDLYINIDEFIKNKYIFKNSICIQVRRGDFLFFKPSYIKDQLYFYNGIYEIEKYKKIDNILVMSDDILWCKENLKDDRIVYIEESDYIQLYIATLCENFIICYSTFSVWSIELNIIRNKIIITDKINHFDFFINNSKTIKI